MVGCDKGKDMRNGDFLWCRGSLWSQRTAQVRRHGLGQWYTSWRKGLTSFGPFLFCHPEVVAEESGCQLGRGACSEHPLWEEVC